MLNAKIISKETVTQDAVAAAVSTAPRHGVPQSGNKIKAAKWQWQMTTEIG